ncbi:TetR/AcrR family transcriptional regulator [Winogradskyella sp.]|uniref:TetR/AcrR family transcriptional regulator n=1 Tax=Winogradskyella sp. TaxID=1883156 RepID=UPI00261ED45D|nr:TetR/AcrR family transcriptional regulator [Winogradskyella sp.]
MKTISTENTILEAAKTIFLQKGFAGARMQEIADEAKINKSMLHYYFRNKEQLFGRIMKDSVSIIIPKFVAILDSEDSVIHKFERLVDGYIDTIIANPHIPMFLLNEISQNRVQYMNEAKEKMMEHGTFQSFMMQIVQEQQQGVLNPLPPQHVMLTVMSLIVFPFMAKPIFKNMLEIPETIYTQMMLERKPIVKKMLKDILVK